MKKIIALVGGTVVLIVIVLLGSYWYAGAVARDVYDNAYTDAAQYMPYIEVVDRDYQRGLTHSTETATLRISEEFLRETLDIKALGGSEEARDIQKYTQIKIVSDIQHGPFLGEHGTGAAWIDVKVNFNDDVKNALALLFGDQAPLTVHCKVAFDGSTESTLSSPTAQYKDETTTINWQGMETSFNADDHAAEMSYTMKSAGFQMQNQRTPSVMDLMSYTNMTGKGTFKRVYPDKPTFYLGNAELKLAHLQIADETVNFSADDVVYALNGTDKGDFADVSYTTSAAKLVFNDVAVEAATLALSMNHLNKSALADISFFFTDLYSYPEKMAGSDLAWLDSEQGKALQNSLQTLVRGEPEINIDRFTFKTPQGNVELTAALRFDNASALPPGPIDYKALLDNNVHLIGQLTLPAEFFERLSDQQLGTTDSLVKKGLFTRNGKLLNAQFELKHGSLTLNKQVLF